MKPRWKKMKFLLLKRLDRLAEAASETLMTVLISPRKLEPVKYLYGMPFFHDTQRKLQRIDGNLAGWD